MEQSEEYTYYVVFQKSVFQRPWHIFTGKIWQHCWVFYEIEQNVLVKIEPLTSQLIARAYKCSPEQMLGKVYEVPETVDVVKIMLPKPNNVSYTIRGIINCITIVKFALGVNSFLTLTPWQLRKYLLKREGRSTKHGYCF